MFTQNEMLYKICCLKIQAFNLKMGSWNSGEGSVYEDVCKELNLLEKEYKELYGALPDWIYIDDLFETKNLLETKLKKEGII